MFVRVLWYVFFKLNFSPKLNKRGIFSLKEKHINQLCFPDEFVFIMKTYIFMNWFSTCGTRNTGVCGGLVKIIKKGFK